MTNRVLAFTLMAVLVFAALASTAFPPSALAQGVLAGPPNPDRNGNGVVCVLTINAAPSPVGIVLILIDDDGETPPGCPDGFLPVGP